MNETTQHLLQALADRLGTTVEHLWAVLVRQAPLSATGDMISIVLLGGFTYWVSAKTKLAFKNGKDYDIPLTAGCGFLWFLLTVVVGCGLENIIAGFMNPEFWALKEVLSALKH